MNLGEKHISYINIVYVITFQKNFNFNILNIHPVSNLIFVCLQNKAFESRDLKNVIIANTDYLRKQSIFQKFYIEVVVGEVTQSVINMLPVNISKCHCFIISEYR